jgi:hypothetical protein
MTFDYVQEDKKDKNKFSLNAMRADVSDVL